MRETDDKYPKGEGYLDQTIPRAQRKEALRKAKSTMPSAASKIRAINAIIKNHAHSVRRPHHQGAAGLPVPYVFEGENPKCQQGEIYSDAPVAYGAADEGATETAQKENQFCGFQN